MKLSLVTFFALFFMSTCWAQTQAEWAALNKRVEELEKQQSDALFQAEERENKVNSFLRTNLTVGGFFEPAFIILDGEDTHLQASNTSNLLGVNFAADFTSHLKFVSQFITGLTYPLNNLHNDPNAPLIGLPQTREFKGVDFGSVLTQGYVHYYFDEHYSIMGGIGYVPFGYYAQQREPVLFIRRRGPQILRTPNLIAPFFNGFNLQSRFEKGARSWGFNVYSFNRHEDVKRPGLGERIWWRTPDEAFTAGLSLQTSKFGSEIENVVGGDFRVVLNHFIFTTEYARHIAEGADTWSYFVEPSLFVYKEDILAYVFIDYANNPANTTGLGTNPLKKPDPTKTELSDPIKVVEYGAGINWIPTSYTRFRIGFTYHNYSEDSKVAIQERDYYSLDLSAGVAF